jgi:N-succinyldiaminopimelate aminotransferase
MKPLNALLAPLPTTIFTVMSALAAEKGAINLGQGFPDTDGPADIIAAAAEALTSGSNQYPPLTGLAELREAVAAANRRFYGIEVDPAREVVVTSGATEAITASLIALLDPGDEVVLIEPLYDTYLPVVRLVGAIPRLVRLEPPDWRLERSALEAAFGPRTKLILLNSPMNPTGKVFSRDELALIAALMQRHDAYAVCDEVYEHIVFDGARHIPLMSLPGLRERTVRIGSAGKTFSLTGWKVGYVTAPAPLASVIAKAHQNLTFTTPPNLQKAVAMGLAKEDAYFVGLAESLARRRDRLAAGLTALGFEVLPSQGTYFLVADFAPLGFTGDDVAFSRHLTEAAGVSPIPLSAFYENDPPRHFVRFAFCKDEARIAEALVRLARHFGKARGGEAAPFARLTDGA